MSGTSATFGTPVVAFFVMLLMSVVSALAGTQVLPSPGVDISHPTGVPPTLSAWTRSIDSMQGDRLTYNTISDYNFNYSVTTTVTILGPGEYAGNNQLIYPFRRLVTVARGGVTQILENYTGHSTASEGYTSTHSVAWTAHTESADPAANRFESVDSATGMVSLLGEDAVDAIHAALAKVRGRPENAPAYGQFYYPGEVSNMTTSQLQLPAIEVLREWDLAADYWPFIEFDDAEKPEAFLRTPTDSSKAFQKIQYKFELTPATPLPLVWAEVFTPKDQGGARHHTFLSWAPMPGETESPIYTIDPLGLDPLDTHAAARHPAIDGSYELAVLTVSLAVDANRDGEIKFAHEDAGDATSETQPFRFWINDDIDLGHTVDGSDWEEDDLRMSENGKKDWENNYIVSRRDLEDFARLHIYTTGFNEAIRHGDLCLGLKWEIVTGTPAVKLYKQVEMDGGSQYLTDEAVAQQQVNADYAIVDIRDIALQPQNATRVLVEGSDLFVLPASLFSGLTETASKTYLLFEGCKPGRGQLKIVILKKEGTNYTEIGEGPSLWIELNKIGDMYEHWSVGNGNGSMPDAVAGRVASETGSPTAFSYDRNSLEGNKYILFVHGWNMEKWEKERYAETAYKRLYWQGYKGRFGLFSWPTTNGFSNVMNAILDSTNFDRGEFSAWRSAEPLRRLLQTLSSAYGGELYIFSHSMGGIVASEALRLQSDANGGSIAKVYVASQTALSVHTYDGTLVGIAGSPNALQWHYTHPLLHVAGNYGPNTANIYKNWMAFMLDGSAISSSAVARSVNFYNENDWALAAPVWQFNQITKPDYADLPSQPYQYYYTGDIETPPFDGFRRMLVSILDATSLTTGSRIVLGDRYEIMAFAAESRVKALGATPDISQGISGAVDLRTIWPDDDGDYQAHKWHSGQFRSTIQRQRNYWKTLLGDQAFDIPSITLP